MFLREDMVHSTLKKAGLVLARIERRFGAVGPHQRTWVLGTSLPELQELEARLSDAQSPREVWS